MAAQSRPPPRAHVSERRAARCAGARVAAVVRRSAMLLQRLLIRARPRWQTGRGTGACVAPLEPSRDRLAAIGVADLAAATPNEAFWVLTPVGLGVDAAPVAVLVMIGPVVAIPVNLKLARVVHLNVFV